MYIPLSVLIPLVRSRPGGRAATARESAPSPHAPTVSGGRKQTSAPIRKVSRSLQSRIRRHVPTRPLHVTSLHDPFLFLLLYFPGFERMFDCCVCFGFLFTSDDHLGHTFILLFGTFSSADASNLLIPINRLLHVGLKPSIYGRAARL